MAGLLPCGTTSRALRARAQGGGQNAWRTLCGTAHRWWGHVRRHPECLVNAVAQWRPPRWWRTLRVINPQIRNTRPAHAGIGGGRDSAKFGCCWTMLANVWTNLADIGQTSTRICHLLSNSAGLFGAGSGQSLATCDKLGRPFGGRLQKLAWNRSHTWAGIGELGLIPTKFGPSSAKSWVRVGDQFWRSSIEGRSWGPGKGEPEARRRTGRGSRDVPGPNFGLGTSASPSPFGA